jgi:hypothetical protein
MRFRHGGLKATLILTLFLFSVNAFAQSEPAAVIEIGAAPGWSIAAAGGSFSPTVAIEFTPIENRLEVELGVTPTFTRHSTEWDTDILFKKPWTLSKKVEFMFGVGPEWINTWKYGIATNSVAGEVALDFMFWPAARHRFGWYLEPAYDHSFWGGREQSVGMSGGLLIAIP